MGLFIKLIKRFKQPTSWAGVTTLLSLVGVAVKPELMVEIVAAGTGIVGMLLIIFDESKPTEE